MAVTKKQKEQTLAELIDAFKKAKSVVFSQYQGTNVKNIKALRRKLREQKVDFKVARKTLMKIAAKKVGFEEIPEAFLQGPIGLAFAMEDDIAPAKVINDFGKTCETVKIAGAIFEGKMMSAADAKAIAGLPSKKELLAQFVGMCQAPIAGFHAVLHGLMRNFVYALAEVQKKKPSSA